MVRPLLPLILPRVALPLLSLPRLHYICTPTRRKSANVPFFVVPLVLPYVSVLGPTELLPVLLFMLL